MMVYLVCGVLFFFVCYVVDIIAAKERADRVLAVTVTVGLWPLVIFAVVVKLVIIWIVHVYSED
ncbi:hypothetical protein [Klebsiella pneumoniae]|uniref:hypothetical protein n=1 Tax=Klebsiella pneumoniae TaxID=573 RepID=UPI000665202F|nr:hypothetical protein [Klebsiella pneumoniae]RFC02452.1 hypothetical protein DDJ49_27775 [Klebsiella pneumoniae]HBS7486956.1 hypothetical protein [Klebsiella pneumoniae]HBV3750990.1 hypothetical protein [Klebsiella pneumoniae]HCJ1525698.1 hypothetical protein [Klebsiella pneumoniae]HCJ1673266.1 hypothetical protein [Klebsiella pneumoniae]